MDINQIDKAVEVGEIILELRGGVNPPSGVPNLQHEETNPSPREPTLSPEVLNMPHEETNASPREPTLSPEGSSPPHQETNPSPREPTLSPVEPNQPLAQFALRRLHGCSFFGCNHGVAQGMRYCSQDHSQMANNDKDMAYVVVDDFFNVQERNARCIISVMKKENGIMTGIDTIQDSTIFKKIPWEWEDWIDRDYLDLELVEAGFFTILSLSQR
ncbi:predicted protein [Arabidopsis lyrata subsp. lyrata]|uniref:Predicted protein n=1 Tax=Arabidopsis lyrata subsp. lyrata TaxID=81972 RepID=D7LLE3_ARALL|nr:predicted protein [Arabidopsis lyrata subsp. lyrata]